MVASLRTKSMVFDVTEQSVTGGTLALPAQRRGPRWDSRVAAVILLTFVAAAATILSTRSREHAVTALPAAVAPPLAVVHPVRAVPAPAQKPRPRRRSTPTRRPKRHRKTRRREHAVTPAPPHRSAPAPPVVQGAPATSAPAVLATPADTSPGEFF